MIQKISKSPQIKIGTSGYSYEDWRHVFYPADLPKGQMLDFYQQFFNTVEINSSYYRIPNRKTIERMVDKTGPGFEFIVKTNQETTHRRVENKAALSQLTEALKPMIDSGKFWGFLAQFPYAFHNTEKNRRYLAETKNLVGDLPIFVEFRHNSWNKIQLASFLRNHDIGYVNVDEPALNGLLPAQHIVTSGMAYVRLHGRNEKDWWDGQGSARYDFEYKSEQLSGWISHINQILKQTSKSYVFFNNHPRGQAIKNARQMIAILEEQLSMDLQTPSTK